MEFVPIASSSGGCCYLVKGGGAPLLVECGLAPSRLKAALGFRLTELAGCLVSHSHGDHCQGVQGLLSLAVDCYASRETWAALHLAGCHRAHPVTAREGFRVGGYDVMPFEAVHDAPGTLGFLVAQGGEKLLYLTDTAYCPFRFEGLTVLAVECNWGEEAMRQSHIDGRVHSERFRRTARNHMSLERLVTMLRANDLSQVREIFLLHLSDANADEAAFKDAVARATGKPVIVAPSRTGAVSRSGSSSTGAAPVGDLDDFEETARRR